MSCEYNRSTKTEKDSCPFNTLYWNFYLEHEDVLSKNPRIGMVYTTLRKMSAEDIDAIKQKSKSILDNLENL